MNEAIRQHAVSLLERLTGRPVRPFATIDFGREAQPACASAVVAADAAAALLRQVRAGLEPGLVAFLGTRHGAREVELVVGPGESQLDILRLAGTSAPNHDLTTEALVERLAEIDRHCGITIVQAESDTLVFDLRSLPDDVAALAREISALCPDIVDQGCGTVEALAEGIEITERVYLWWD